MKKIDLVISSVNLDYGGIEKSLVNFINNLNKNLYNVTLFLEEKKGAFLNDIKDINIKEYKPSKYKMINLLKRIKLFITSYKKYDISICYATYSLSSNMIARVCSKKRIFYVHSNYYELFNHDELKIREFFDKRYIEKFDKVIFVSNESRNNLLNYYPVLNNKSEVINNIINIDEIITKSKEKCDLKLNHKNNGIFIGRFDEVKQIDKILNLAKECQDNKKDIGFIIVGDGPQKDYLYKLKSKLNLKNVDFVGSQSNPYKYLNKADFLILTSKYEGFPVVYNEAIILNKPILTILNITDDLISIDKRFGLVTNADNLYKDMLEIIKFKNEKIDFNQINMKRIDEINELIKGLYEK